MAQEAFDNSRFGALLKLAQRGSKFTGEGFDTSNTDWSSIKILVVGAGGLGCELLHCLALSGFTEVDVIDMDTIDLSNLNRQFLFRNADVGKPKAEVAAAFIKKRYPYMKITAHFGRIEAKDDAFYRGFHICILGLDSIHARNWMNEKYAGLAEWGHVDGKFRITSGVPVIDGGTEGFKGHVRVIQFGKGACISCPLDLFPPTRAVPMCTIENVPRVPEHCVLYAKVKMWEDQVPFGKGVSIDGDNSDHIDWITKKAKERQAQFGLAGEIDYAFTLGVVKNVVPAVGFTNAMVAAGCVNEALKLAVGLGKAIDNFAFYNGAANGIGSSVNVFFPHPDCLVCQCHDLTLQKAWTPTDLVLAAFTYIQSKLPADEKAKIKDLPVFEGRKPNRGVQPKPGAFIQYDIESKEFRKATIVADGTVTVDAAAAPQSAVPDEFYLRAADDKGKVGWVQFLKPDAQIILTFADAKGESVEFPLRQIGPLAFETQAYQAVPILQTMKENNAQGDTFRFRVEGGFVGSRTTRFIAQWKA